MPTHNCIMTRTNQVFHHLLALMTSLTILHDSQINGKLGKRTLIESRASCLSDQMEGDMRLGWVDPYMDKFIDTMCSEESIFLANVGLFNLIC
jgi:hypothetical protein